MLYRRVYRCETKQLSGFVVCLHISNIIDKMRLVVEIKQSINNRWQVTGSSWNFVLIDPIPKHTRCITAVISNKFKYVHVSTTTATSTYHFICEKHFVNLMVTDTQHCFLVTIIKKNEKFFFGLFKESIKC